VGTFKRRHSPSKSDLQICAIAATALLTPVLSLAQNAATAEQIDEMVALLDRSLGEVLNELPPGTVRA